MPTTTDEDARRIAERYPVPAGRHRTYQLLVALLTVALVGWLGWAGWHGSNPPVSADVHGFTVVDDSHARATLRVQRTDPSKPAVCTLKATAENFVQVGELAATVPPGTEKITMFTTELKTVNRATTVTVEGCRTA